MSGDRVAAPRAKITHLAAGPAAVACGRARRDTWTVADQDDARDLCAACADTTSDPTPSGPAKVAGPRSRKTHRTVDAGATLLCRRKPRAGWGLVAEDDGRAVCEECAAVKLVETTAAEATDELLEELDATRAGTNLNALRLTLATMKTRGELDGVPVASIFATASLATAVDTFPANAALWKQYREALAELTDTAGSDAFTSLLTELLTEPADA